ncbi:MAG TPA: serine hydroxymethyltransferase [Jatrophihabitans sp.]|jgi:glycine hydroxymethyltransferase|uniref:serine hydroxymethyltransferase n=1 Tax=Jatrophihabitans sp. TaxID=1932789 RepID=UPI002EEB4162
MTELRDPIHSSPEDVRVTDDEHTSSSQARLVRAGLRSLWREDAALAAMLDDDVDYQRDTLALIASASVAHPSVLAAGAAALANVTAEGYPGARYHSGTQQFDAVETLAVARAKLLFGSQYANVQPHSCSSANLAVLAALVPSQGTLLGLDLDSGGHLTHGSSASVTGEHYRAVHYGLDRAGRIDFGQVAELAQAHRPQVLIAGGSAYPRTLDFERFRAIADSVGAYLLADISHIAGLVVAGEHPSPIDLAHVTTTSTYKQLGGPRGGLILIGKEASAPGPSGRGTLAGAMQRAVFPRVQGTPNPSSIAAKARAFDLAAQPDFARTVKLIRQDAHALATALAQLGYPLVTGGTDTHMVLIDLSEHQLTGVAAERALESCGILVNRNRIPADTKPPLVTSGLRLGTNIAAQRGMGPEAMAKCAQLIDAVLSTTVADSDNGYLVDARTASAVSTEVKHLCARYPLYEESDR